MRNETPAERFTQNLNALTRDLENIGLYWRGDLAQFRVIGKKVIHVCGAATPMETADEHRLDIIAKIATIHLQGCELRQGQGPMPQVPEDQDPQTTA